MDPGTCLNAVMSLLQTCSSYPESYLASLFFYPLPQVDGIMISALLFFFLETGNMTFILEGVGGGKDAVLSRFILCSIRKV